MCACAVSFNLESTTTDSDINLTTTSATEAITSVTAIKATDQGNQENEDQDGDIYIIVGAIGATVLVIVTGLVVCLVYRKRRQERPQEVLSTYRVTKQLVPNLPLTLI